GDESPQKSLPVLVGLWSKRSTGGAGRPPRVAAPLFFAAEPVPLSLRAAFRQGARSDSYTRPPKQAQGVTRPSVVEVSPAQSPARRCSVGVPLALWVNRTGREVAVAIVDQETRLDVLPVLELPRHVSRLLSGPGSARMLAAGSEQDAPAPGAAIKRLDVACPI